MSTDILFLSGNSNRQNWEENEDLLPSFFRQLQAQICVSFLQSEAYPIGVAREQAQHSIKNELDYLITVVWDLVYASMKL